MCRVQVARTEKGQQLPVYTDFRNGRTRVLTLVRRCSGQPQVCGTVWWRACWAGLSSHRVVHQVLARELKKVCGHTDVEVRQGRVEVKGNYRREVKEYLAGLGF